MHPIGWLAHAHELMYVNAEHSRAGGVASTYAVRGASIPPGQRNMQLPSRSSSELPSTCDPCSGVLAMPSYVTNAWYCFHIVLCLWDIFPVEQGYSHLDSIVHHHIC